ncbi:hypothetical protein HanHA300_Chr14g0545161 [Helianthus annuus]|nr:hypothetical protein HanHA300_Chr14g0545161 [Helianthus annuus]KAJ0658099.1 hypothetical protein HanLR1_Chr14g0554001 [Helianthus annuus]KAJ0661765.1 hypothetical protein HanOQP8_Chr14g0552111 [Helianthus annuus]
MVHFNIFNYRFEEEQNAAEESFSVYFKPVELYKCLGVRASRKPLFRANCLRYKLEEKHKRRVQLSVSISRPLDDGPQTMHIFPLYVVLARPVPTTNAEALQSIRYRFKRACKVIAFNIAPTMRSPRARFILPEINKLSTEFKSGSLAILLVSFGMFLSLIVFGRIYIYIYIYRVRFMREPPLLREPREPM